MAASELILNSDGSIYHLGLLPKHVPLLVITVGDPERVEEVSRHFDHIDFRQNKREFCSHVGSFAERPVLCISTGIGTDNIDIVVNELDALVNVDLQSGRAKTRIQQLTFIRLGTSGTFQSDIKVDSILASREAVGLDGLGPFYHFPEHHGASLLRKEFPAFACAAYGAMAHSELLQAWHLSGGLSGSTLTCAGFYGPQRRSLRLPFAGPSLAQLASIEFGETRNLSSDNRFSNFEMETAGIYGLATALGHRALSINAILANRATGEFSAQPAKTVAEMIKSMFALLRSEPSFWWGETYP